MGNPLKTKPQNITSMSKCSFCSSDTMCYLQKRGFSHVERTSPEVCEQSLGAGV